MLLPRCDSKLCAADVSLPLSNKMMVLLTSMNSTSRRICSNCYKNTVREEGARTSPQAVIVTSASGLCPAVLPLSIFLGEYRILVSLKFHEGWGVVGGNEPDDIHAVNDFAEDDVLACWAQREM
jgi:hypothetical protein